MPDEMNAIPRPPTIPNAETSGLSYESLADGWRKAYLRRTNVGIGLSFVLSFGSRLLQTLSPALFLNAAHTSYSPAGIAFLAVLAIPSLLLWIWGCQGYAMSKGYSPTLGYLGFLTFLGLLVLALLPKKQVQRPTKKIMELPLLKISLGKEPSVY